MNQAWRTSVEVVLLVTSACSRHCPHCCFRDWMSGPSYEAAPESVARDIKALGPVGKVILLGGEATLHSRFEELLRSAREAIGSGSLWLCTNGARLIEKAAATELLDGVRFSIFTELSNAGNLPSNVSIAREYMRVKPPHVGFQAGVVYHQVSGGCMPCKRREETLGVLDGRVYPCCVAPGVRGADSAPLVEGWDAVIRSVALPCDRCALST